jgi:hypothetical protein
MAGTCQRLEGKSRVKEEIVGHSRRPLQAKAKGLTSGQRDPLAGLVAISSFTLCSWGGPRPKGHHSRNHRPRNQKSMPRVMGTLGLGGLRPRGLCHDLMSAITLVGVSADGFSHTVGTQSPRSPKKYLAWRSRTHGSTNCERNHLAGDNNHLRVNLWLEPTLELCSRFQRWFTLDCCLSRQVLSHPSWSYTLQLTRLSLKDSCSE